MGQIHQHPLEKQSLELLDDGTVEVVDLEDNTKGVFDRNGVWLYGELKTADPQMIRYVAAGTGRAKASS